VAEQSLNTDQKIQILRRWEYDARELAVAEEESMSGGVVSFWTRSCAAFTSWVFAG